MKTSILSLLSLFLLASCQKEATVAPATVPATTSTRPATSTTSTSSSATTTTTTPVTVAANPDTIPDMAAFKLKMAMDSTNSDETMFLFNKTSQLNYDANVDGAYFAGYGLINLSGISKDGQNVSVYNLPYTSGMAIGLNADAKADGKYLFKISYARKIPANVQIWIKDTFLKDSVNVRKGNYSFSISKADTNTFGSKRFKLIIKSKS